MKAVLLMFDSLNRNYLSPYGNEDIATPNFQRLAQRGVTFGSHYAGSLPCIPARRELHTGRYNFLHRSWGPLEPFDESVFETLKHHNVHTHLITDHQHYWEDGGATYHNRYSSYEFVRGQEGDLWKSDLSKAEAGEHLGRRSVQDDINRSYCAARKKYPLDEVFELGKEFLERNHEFENWFLQIECFDPHEPFVTEPKYKNRYPDDYLGPRFDWPEYGDVKESRDAVEHMKNHYAALVTKCDEKLGEILDLFDHHNLWKDTALILNTDHGFLLGEHDSWAKCVQPFYEEVAHIPLFYWDPRLRASGQRTDSLTQTIDIAPTLLDLFDLPKGKHMLGVSLAETLQKKNKEERYGLFGLHGGQLNITDGKYVYMKSPIHKESPLYNYTLMLTHMRKFFSDQELKSLVPTEGFSFTKSMKLWRSDANFKSSGDVQLTQEYPDMLFDIEEDPLQAHVRYDADIIAELERQIVRLMEQNEAPEELYGRYGLKRSGQ